MHYDFIFSSYKEALQCVSNLVISCPESTQRQVEEALYNYKNIQEELTELCTTQRLYECKYRVQLLVVLMGKKQVITNPDGVEILFLVRTV